MGLAGARRICCCERVLPGGRCLAAPYWLLLARAVDRFRTNPADKPSRARPETAGTGATCPANLASPRVDARETGGVFNREEAEQSFFKALDQFTTGENDSYPDDCATTAGPDSDLRISPATGTLQSSGVIERTNLASGLVNPLIPADPHAAPTVNRLRRVQHRRAAHGLAAALSSSQALTFLELNRVRPTTAINYNDRGEAFRKWVEEAQMPLDDASLLDEALCEFSSTSTSKGSTTTTGTSSSLR